MSDPALPYRITVDGELWEVVERGGGHYDFTWLSGIDQRYGFTSRIVGPSRPMSTEAMQTQIREFMSNVNPRTGHLD